MTSLADRTIAQLRAEHETLAPLVVDLTDDRLSGPSAATQWSLAHVLSHLGSGAEIMLAGVRAAIGAGETPGPDYNTTVWDRWNAQPSSAQRDGYLEYNGALLSTFETLDADQRQQMQLEVGFLPAPLPVSAFSGMRLNEAALHGWDIRVALDPSSRLLPDSAQLIAELFSGQLGFMLGFIGKADQIVGPVLLDIAGSGFGLDIRDSVTMVSPAKAATATFTGPLEAAIRMVAGRLGPEYTPAGLTVSGNANLAGLRLVFPGY